MLSCSADTSPRLLTALSTALSLCSTQAGPTTVLVSSNTFITSCMLLMQVSRVSELMAFVWCRPEMWVAKFLHDDM